MKLWLDDVRPAPEGYIWAKTVDEAIYELIVHQKEIDSCWQDYILGICSREQLEKHFAVWRIEEVSCDNDLGEYEPEGYKLLDWLEATGHNYPIHIHTDNAVA